MVYGVEMIEWSRFPAITCQAFRVNELWFMVYGLWLIFFWLMVDCLLFIVYCL